MPPKRPQTPDAVPLAVYLGSFWVTVWGFVQAKWLQFEPRLGSFWATAWGFVQAKWPHFEPPFGVSVIC